MKKISVIGLGKLGAPLLATMASRGFDVVGIDINPKVVAKINQKKAPVDEPQLQPLIRENAKRIKATTDFEKGINNTAITFIIVPTPSNGNGGFSNEYVLKAVKSIGKVLAKKFDYHTVAVTSTVLPGTIDNEVIPTLEKISGKKVNYDFGVCYNPEFIALGSVIKDLLNPDLVLIGESDSKSGELLEKFYRKFCLNNPPIFRMSPINAEIAKIALNSYITTKISFANTLAEICQKVPGGDVDEITRAIGSDSRIGTRYLKGSLPYGGPCFPRDNRAFSYFAKKIKVDTPIARATDEVNEHLSKVIADKIEKIVKGRKNKVSILGLAYKPDTDVAEESAGVKLANYLSKNTKVFVWDPKAIENAKLYLSKRVSIAKDLTDCVRGASILVITTPWAEFRNLKLTPQNPHKPVLIDCWRILDPIKYQEVANYQTLGKG